jgi:hypothetical protein
MKKRLEEYRRFIFAGTIVIALGISFNSGLGENSGSLGTVFVAIGGLLFIIGMSKKKEEENKNIN